MIEFDTGLGLSAEVAVEQGITWLDEVKPDWLDLIDHPLDMMSLKRCVTGQVFEVEGNEHLESGYEYAHNLLTDEYPAVKPAMLGFEASYWNTYAVLELVWNQEIEKRRFTARR